MSDLPSAGKLDHLTTAARPPSEAIELGGSWRPGACVRPFVYEHTA